MVGDGLHDMQSGNAAGAATCLLKHNWNLNAQQYADFVIESLNEVEGIINEHSS
jgi:phosphoglycolate phosphatase-like HAD superfamily hydrolase